MPKRMKYKKLEDLGDRLKEKEDDAGTNRLTSLPEAIVIYILSFLKTKNAVQISMTLKKWVNLWKFLPSFEFVEDLTFKNSNSFDKFVNKVLSLRDDSVKIKKFSYQRRQFNYKSRRYSKPNVDKIVKYVVSHEVPHFNFDTDTCGYTGGLVNLLGSCDSFKSLELRYVTFNCSLSLKELVTLHLVGSKLIKMENFSGCPNLKDLTLVGSNYNGWNIVAPQLSWLTIVNCFDSFVKVMLSTPRLRFFRINGSLRIVLPLLQTDELTQLETIEVDFAMEYPFSAIEQHPPAMSSSNYTRLISMLKFFHNAKSVGLSHDAVKLLSLFPHALETEPSPFCDLKILNIDRRRRYKTDPLAIPCHVVTYLLGKSPQAKIINKF